MGGEKQNEDGYPKYLPLEDGKVLYRPPFSTSGIYIVVKVTKFLHSSIAPTIPCLFVYVHSHDGRRKEHIELKC